jgi:hypothetical protein
MENDSATPDSPKQTTPAARDPLIRYSVFAALGCAGVCMIFTILYVFSYSLDSTLSFERHFDSYLASANSGNLSTVLGLHMAQNRMFLQSCGMVAGIFFAFLGLALFLVGIQGTTDATGEVRDYSTNIKRLAPGGIILLASMIFVGVSAMHPIDLQLSPAGTPVTAAPTAAVDPPAAQPAAPAAAQPSAQPAITQPATQSQAAPAPQTAPTQQQTTTTAHLTPQYAPQPAPMSAPLSATHPTLQLPTQQPATIPAQTPAQHPASRPALVPVNQSAAATPNRVPPTHHFQP